MSSLIVAILGAKGFLGSHIAQSCTDVGIPLVELERWSDNRDLFDNQIRDLRLTNPDSQIVLIQAAWYSTDNIDYRTSPENNKWVEITKAILESCNKWNLIFAGLGTCLENLQAQNDVYSSTKSKIQSDLTHVFPDEDWLWFQLHYVYSLDRLCIHFVCCWLHLRYSTSPKPKAQKNFHSLRRRLDYCRLRVHGFSAA